MSLAGVGHKLDGGSKPVGSTVPKVETEAATFSTGDQRHHRLALRAGPFQRLPKGCPTLMVVIDRHSPHARS